MTAAIEKAQQEYAESIAAALEESPVYVDAGMRDVVPPEVEENLVSATEEITEFPTFAVVLGRSTDAPQILERVAEAHGEDAVYLATDPEGYVVWSRSELPYEAQPDFDVHTAIKNGYRSVGDDSHGIPKLFASLDALAHPEDYATEEEAGTDDGAGGADTSTIADAGTDGVPESTDPIGGTVAPWIIGAVVPGAVVGVVVGIARKRRDGKPARAIEEVAPAYAMPEEFFTRVKETQRANLRRELTQDSLHISERLAELETAGLEPARAERVHHGLDAYSIAGRIVDDPDSDQVDLAGALVLLRTAAQDVDAVEQTLEEPSTKQNGKANADGGKPGKPGKSGKSGKRSGAGRRKDAAPRALCLFDPLHGDSVRTVRAEAPGTGRIVVPACDFCADEVDAGRSPDWLFDGGKPYIEQDTVWARSVFGATGADLVREVQRSRGWK